VHPHAEHRPGAPRRRVAHELADVIRLCGDAFARAHTLSREQSRTLRDVAACRTEKLGGHLDVCESCGVCRPSYNSCRNRHCPKCQALRQAQWVDARSEKLLPTHHFHVVFTLPAELRSVAFRDRRKVFELLFACAWQTLSDLATDRLAARLAVTAVLHTWSRDLGFHPHVHCIVSGGGYDQTKDRWVASGRKFLFPVHVMGKLFRGKMLAALRAAVARGELDLGDDDPESFFGALYRKRWVVYAKRPFGDVARVVRYLGLYTHRVGISNQRIESVTDAAVRFRTRDGKHATVTPTEFLRRFLLHVLPSGFVKIRHFGLLAPGNAQRALERARARLTPQALPRTAPIAPRAPRSGAELLLALLGIDVRACAFCRERARVRRPIDDAYAPSPIARDTS
jgi:hypothetical protein